MLNAALLFFLTMYFFPLQPQGRAELRVMVEGIRNTDGVLRICLFNEEKGFPTDPEYAMRVQSLSVSGGSMEIVFSDLPPGNYALSVLHDENEDGQMSFSWVGFPKEGYGCSNNVKGLLGPPRFEKAVFNLISPVTRQKLIIRY